MRSIILDFLIPGALLWGLSSAERSVLVLNWIWFQRPYTFSWSFWSQMPVFRIAVAFMAVSNVARGTLRFKFPKLLIIYLAFLTWLTISTFAAYYPPTAWAIYKEYLPSMWASPILMFAAINNLELLKKVMWVAAGSIGLIAVKTGIVLTAKGGAHLTADINGFVGDNNVFGLTLCVVFSVLMGLRVTLPKGKWPNRIFFACIVFLVLCIIYTESRGAMLTMVVILAARAVISRKRFRNMATLLAVIFLTLSVVPYRFFHRMNTLNDIRANASAMGRIQNWELSWQEALRYPILGVGPGNHIPYALSHPHNVQVRVAHSIYFQILAEEGFPGLLLYLLFCAATLSNLASTWRYAISIGRKYPDLDWTRNVVSWLTCGYLGFLFGSAFLNMLYIEFPWYVPFYAIMLNMLVKKEVNSRVSALERMPASSDVAGALSL